MPRSVASGWSANHRIATTVLAVINHDPKHGRWILPLIIVAMVVLTYTFVQALEASYAGYLVRLIGGFIFFAGMLVMAYNVYMTATRSTTQEEETGPEPVAATA